MLELYDVVRDSMYWININQIVSVTCKDKNDKYEGAVITLSADPFKIVTDKKPQDVINSISLLRRLTK